MFLYLYHTYLPRQGLKVETDDERDETTNDVKMSIG